LKKGLLYFIVFILAFSHSRSQVVTASFTCADTVCVNQAFSITNQCAGANSYYWSFCQGGISGAPTATNLGNIGLFSMPVFVTIAKDGPTYYAFVNNNFPGSISRLNFGNSLLNNPTAVNLGNLGGSVPNNLEDIFIINDAGTWYGFLVGGMSGAERIVRLNFGTSLANTPTATNMGNIGSMNYPQRLQIFKSGGNYYGFTVNHLGNSITRFSFGSSLNNVPTGTNLGNLGSLNMPDAISLITLNNLWYGYIINEGSSTITRLDFGNSLLNVPTGVNLGNPGFLNGPRGLDVWTECDQIKGLITNRNNNTLLGLNFPTGPTGSIITSSFGNIGSLSFPHCVTRFRSSDTLYAFIANVNNNSLTRIYYPGCTNASIASSTLATPPAVSYNTPGTYYISVTVNEAQITQTSYCKQVVVVNGPTLNVSSNTGPGCSGNAVTLSASGASSYTWSPGGFSTQSVTVSPSTLTTYSVSGSMAGCTDTKTISVVVNSLPTISISSSTNSICNGAAVNLNSSGALSYTWLPGGMSGSQVSVNPSTSTTYTVIGSNGSCTNTATSLMNVNPTPVVAVTSSGSGCLGNQMNLVANGSLPYNYQWSGPDGFSSGLQSPSFIASSLNNSGYYSVSVLDPFTNCTYSTGINIAIAQFTTTSISSSVSKGCVPVCVSYTVNNFSASTPVSWVYGDGSQTTSSINSAHCYTTAGTYTVKILAGVPNSCQATADFTVHVNENPTADFNHSPIKPVINIDQVVNFTDASFSNIVGWNWYFTGTAEYQSIQQNPVFSYAEPGKYPVALVVKDKNGCTDTIVRIIEVGEDYGIYVPNAFTPNEDGLNDIFQPKGFGIVKFEMQIFDRWGEKIFETSEFEKGWEGNYQGRGIKICPSDVYAYRISLTNVFGKSYQLNGHVTLMR
jgi:gliding motility-associated-like protein